MDWWIYVLVGIVVGMNMGYMIGIRRGAAIVGELIEGIAVGVAGMTGVVSDNITRTASGVADGRTGTKE